MFSYVIPCQNITDRQTKTNKKIKREKVKNYENKFSKLF